MMTSSNRAGFTGMAGVMAVLLLTSGMPLRAQDDAGTPERADEARRVAAAARQESGDPAGTVPGMESRAWVYYPAPRASGELQTVLGFRVLTLPREIVEEEINKAPALDFRASLGLPLQAELIGGAVLQYLTNQLRAGLRWSHDLGGFAVGASYEVAFWFGRVTIEGFNNRAIGWTHYPGVTIGHDFGDVRLAVAAELIWMQTMRTFAGDIEIRSRKNRVAGGAVTVVLEQPFWKRTQGVLGVRLAMTDFHYQSWFAFPTFERRLLYSELLLGILL